MSRAGWALALVVACVWPLAAASAATVYRCGSQGRVYSQTPCPEPGGQTMNVEGEVSGTRQAQALEVARRESALARSLSKAPRAKRPTRATGRAAKADAPPEGASGATVLPVHEVSVGTGGRPTSPEPVLHPRKARRGQGKASADFVAKVPKAATAPAPASSGH